MDRLSKNKLSKSIAGPALWAVALLLFPAVQALARGPAVEDPVIEEPAAEDPAVEVPAVEIPGVQLGQRLPEAALILDLVDPDGERRGVADLVGEQGTLLIFTSNTCPYVTDWLDRFPRLATFAREHDMAFLLVNANARKRKTDDSPEAMAALAEEHGFEFPYWIDEASALADAVGAQRTPEVFLFDAALELVYRGAIDDHSGPFDQVGQHWALDALRQMVDEVSITTPSTAALGCKVQRPRKRRTKG